MNLSLSKTDYDPFIDYLKGICIVFVILTHCISRQLETYSLFCLWGAMAVPIFLLIQVFHAYKKKPLCHNLRLVKLWHRIVLPFLLTQFACVILLLLMTRGDLAVFFETGNLGPGSYYPYIFLQFYLLSYLFAPIYKYINNLYVLCIIFVLLSQFFEWVSIFLNVKPEVYRLLFFRYFFIIFLGYLLSIDKIVLNRYTFFLGILSTLFILSAYGIIGGGNVVSCFCYMKSWQIYHWISYFYVAYLLLFLIRWSYSKSGSSSLWGRFIILCGKYSYEIFLFQMLFFLVSPINVVSAKFGINTSYIEPLLLLLNVLFCTLPVIVIKRYYHKLSVDGFQNYTT